MSKEVITNALILIGEYDVSGNHNQIALNYGADTQEATAFGGDTHVMQPGLKTVGFSGAGYWEADGTTERPDLTHHERVGSTEVPVAIAKGNAAGDRAYLLNGGLGTYNPLDGNAVGDMHSFSIEGFSASALIRTTLMANESGVAADGNSAIQQLGEVGSDQKLYSGLFVLSASGTGSTLDVTIESDVDTNFGDADETTRITHSQFTAAGTERLDLAGAVTDTHYRASWTVGGTSPAFTFALVLGIQ